MYIPGKGGSFVVDLHLRSTNILSNQRKRPATATTSAVPTGVDSEYSN